MSNYLIDDGQNKIPGYSAAETDEKFAYYKSFYFPAGSTLAFFTDSHINENSIIDFYSSDYAVSPSSVEIDLNNTPNPSVTVRIEAQTENVYFKMRVM